MTKNAWAGLVAGGAWLVSALFALFLCVHAHVTTTCVERCDREFSGTTSSRQVATFLGVSASCDCSSTAKPECEPERDRGDITVDDAVIAGWSVGPADVPMLAPDDRSDIAVPPYDRCASCADIDFDDDAKGGHCDCDLWRHEHPGAGGAP